MATTLVPVEQYLRKSYPDGDCEYVDGETRIVVYLVTHHPQFWAAGAVRVQVQSSRIRVPDVTLAAGARPAGRIITAPPHLVVEVLSADDRAGAVQEKIDDYLAFGIPYVWIVNPGTGPGYVHTTEAAREAKDGILRTADPAVELPLYELLGK